MLQKAAHPSMVHAARSRGLLVAAGDLLVAEDIAHEPPQVRVREAVDGRQDFPEHLVDVVSCAG